MMKRWSWMGVGIVIASSAMVVAQPPDGPRDAPFREGPRMRGDGNDRPPQNPLLEALDANHDHVISADEILQASAALLKLDKNHDGQLSDEELRPDMAGPPRDGGGSPRDGGGPPRDGGGPPRDGGGPPRDGGGPPPDGFGPPRGDAGPPRDFAGTPRNGFGPPRDGAGPQRGDAGPPADGRQGPPGGPDNGPPPPDPARFVEHAMQFDANKDGMLSRDELMKFAEEMPNHQPGGMRGGPGGPGAGGPGSGGSGPGGSGPGGSGPGGRPGRGGEAAPNTRPSRPASDN